MTLVTLAAAALATLATAAAAQPMVPFQALNTTATTPDFIKAAGEADLYVIEESRLAAERTQDLRVRAFAQELVQAHTQTTQALKQAVHVANLREPPPPSLRPDQKVLIDALKEERGVNFDDLYLEQQAEAHEDALLAMQTYAAQGDAPALRQAAVQTTPLLMRHLETVKRLQRGP